MGFFVPRRLRAGRWALTPPFHPYRPSRGEARQPAVLFSVTLSVVPGLGRERPRVLRGMLPCGVRTFLPASAWQRRRAIVCPPQLWRIASARPRNKRKASAGLPAKGLTNRQPSEYASKNGPLGRRYFPSIRACGKSSPSPATPAASCGSRFVAGTWAGTGTTFSASSVSVATCGSDSDIGETLQYQGNTLDFGLSSSD
jgi:hypothetical protein